MSVFVESRGVGRCGRGRVTKYIKGVPYYASYRKRVCKRVCKKVCKRVNKRVGMCQLTRTLVGTPATDGRAARYSLS